MLLGVVIFKENNDTDKKWLKNTVKILKKINREKKIVHIPAFTGLLQHGLEKHHFTDSGAKILLGYRKTLDT